MENSARVLKKLKNTLLVSAVAAVIIGLIFILAPSVSSQMICYFIGGVLCAVGAYNLISYFIVRRKEQFTHGLVGSTALLAAGIFVFVRASFIIELLAVIIGIVMLIDGVAKLEYAIDLKRLGKEKSWALLIPAVLVFALGLFIVFFPGSGDWFMIFIGVVLIFDGLSDLFSMLWISKHIKQAAKREDDTEITE